MYGKSFGNKKQVYFDSITHYYEFLGYLAKNDGSTSIVWENNSEQGAWADEGRLHFYVEPKALAVNLKHTAGSSSMWSRVNCNDFVQHIIEYQGFKPGGVQDRKAIRDTVPSQYEVDFDRGLVL